MTLDTAPYWPASPQCLPCLVGRHRTLLQIPVALQSQVTSGLQERTAPVTNAKQKMQELLIYSCTRDRRHLCEVIFLQILQSCNL